MASIPSKPICDPVEDLNERDDAAPHAQPHESTHLRDIECIFVISFVSVYTYTYLRQVVHSCHPRLPVDMGNQ